MERKEEIRFDPIHRTNRLSEWLGEEEEVADGKKVVVLVHVFLGMKGGGETYLKARDRRRIDSRNN